MQFGLVGLWKHSDVLWCLSFFFHCMRTTQETGPFSTLPVTLRQCWLRTPAPDCVPLWDNTDSAQLGKTRTLFMQVQVVTPTSLHNLSVLGCLSKRNPIKTVLLWTGSACTDREGLFLNLSDTTGRQSLPELSVTPLVPSSYLQVCSLPPPSCNSPHYRLFS